MVKLEKRMWREKAAECGVMLDYEPNPAIAVPITIAVGAIGGFVLSGINTLCQHPEYIEASKEYLKSIF